MEQKNREMYSLETELKLLRPFVQKSPTYKRRYSEEDILAAEQRLNYKLPAPLKFMYLYMSDLLFVGYYLRPLELLHWDHDHLGIFPPQRSGIKSLGYVEMQPPIRCIAGKKNT